MLLKLLQKILAFFAKEFIKKYQPLIIGVTGSVGKSSTKEMIGLVLKNTLKIRQNEGNYNNEIGVPLTILGLKSPGKNIIGWLNVFIFAFARLIFRYKKYPEVLVLEMAADRPGDLSYLTKMAPCKIGVLTAISQSHIEFFKSLENIAKEKSAIIKHLPKEGWAILNADDEWVYALRKRTQARILTYGVNSRADVQALDIEIEQELINQKPEIKGLRFKVSYQGNVVPVFLPQVISLAQIYSALAAIATGLALNLNLLTITQALKKYQPLPGRMNLIPGINNSLIIDDTYNSSPQAVRSAFESLERISIDSSARKWVILGDMLELGEFSDEAHYQIGQKFTQMNFDYLITIGEEAREIAKAARETDFDKERILSFDNSLAAIKFLKPRIQSGDIILVKASQGMRLERLVKEIMLNPHLAKKYLVRQTRNWTKK